VKFVSKNAIVVVIAALLVGLFIGYAVERQRAINNMETAKRLFQNQLNAVKTATDKLIIENKQLQMEVSLIPTPTMGIKKIIISTPSAAKK
jgi:uncharacterized membrane-anchored protein YhcB (DUF1043 family)